MGPALLTGGGPVFVWRCGRVASLRPEADAGAFPSTPPLFARRMTEPMKTIDWKKVALRLARDAHENKFSSRRGVGPFDEGQNTYIYNNNPYELQDGMCPKREWETEQLRAWLKAEGIAELGYATYPAEADSQLGYTYAMIVGTPDWGRVLDKLSEILMASQRRLDGQPPELRVVEGGARTER